MKKILLLILLYPLLTGATYYMRADGTAANKAAATACSAASTAMSISTHDGETFSAGDTIYLCDDGGVFRDKMDIPSSGSSGNVITYANATGDTPVISGAALVATWGVHAGSVWKATLATEPNTIWLDSTEGDNKASVGALVNEYDWFWDSNELYVYSTTDPDTAYTDPGIEVRSLDQVFDCEDVDYVTVSGITFTKGLGVSDAMVVFDGITAGGTGFTIQNCTISEAEKRHLQFRDTVDGVISGNTVFSNYNPDTEGSFGIMSGTYGLPTWTATDLTVTNNTVHDLQYGVTLYYVTGSTVSLNTIYTTTAAGLSLMLSPGTHNIYQNTIYDVCRLIDDTNAIQIGTGTGAADTAANIYENKIYEVYQDTLSGSCIILDVSSQNCNVYNNLLHTAEGAGVHVLQSDGHNIYNNVIYDVGSQSKGGIAVAGGDNINIYNNSVYDPGDYGLYLLKTAGNLGTLNVKNNIFSGSATYALYLDNNASMDNDSVYDYNVWYFSAGGMADWSGTTYAALTNWQALDPVPGLSVAQDANSISSDPLFTAVDRNDYTVSCGSIARDRGTNLGASYDDGLDPDSSWPDSVSTLDQDDYSDWDIGAYISNLPCYRMRTY